MGHRHDMLHNMSRGFTLIEISMAVSLLFLVMVTVGNLMLKSSDSMSTLIKHAHANSRALVILDRLEAELVTANFSSMIPAVPKTSNYIEFQKIVGIATDGMPVYGSTTRIELTNAEKGSGSDGIDNDGNGLIDEQAIMIREDQPPLGWGAEDDVTIICTNATKDGLAFTRQGGILLIDLSLQEARHGEMPAILSIQSGVKMRNGK